MSSGLPFSRWFVRFRQHYSVGIALWLTCCATLCILAFPSGAFASVQFNPICPLAATNPSVTICTPGNGAVVSLPLHVVAGTNDTNAVTQIQLLVDGAVKFQGSSNTVDVYLNSLVAGGHSIAVKAVDSAGQNFSQSISATVTANAGLTNIRHIIFYVLENHSFDQYFGMLGPYKYSRGYANDVDGLNPSMTQYTSTGQPVHPFHEPTVCVQGLTPFWNSAWDSIDGGKMDKFLTSGAYTNTDPLGTRSFGYFDQTDLPYYYELATQFATSDRFFSPVLTKTIPNRMYLFAASSFGHIRPDPPPNPPGYWSNATIFDHLDQAGVSWRYYYQNNGVFISDFATYQKDASKLAPISQWYTDIQNEASWPSVIFIERASGTDEKPPSNVQLGAANTAKILNALMKSPSWSSSVFILTYDEAGGYFDHVIPGTVVPPDSIPPMLQKGDYPGDFAHEGFRLPFVLVSPWVVPHYVSHTWRDTSSILRLIETRFNVQPLTARDAAADDMMEFFDFSKESWATPPPLPTQPTKGTCNIQREKAPGF